MLGIDWIPGSQFEIAPEAQQCPGTPCSSFRLLFPSPQNVCLDFHWAVFLCNANVIVYCMLWLVVFGSYHCVCVCGGGHVVACAFKVITNCMDVPYFIQRVVDGHFGSF